EVRGVQRGHRVPERLPDHVRDRLPRFVAGPAGDVDLDVSVVGELRPGGLRLLLDGRLTSTVVTWFFESRCVRNQASAIPAPTRSTVRMPSSMPVPRRWSGGGAGGG